MAGIVWVQPLERADVQYWVSSLDDPGQLAAQTLAGSALRRPGCCRVCPIRGWFGICWTIIILHFQYLGQKVPVQRAIVGAVGVLFRPERDNTSDFQLLKQLS